MEKMVAVLYNKKKASNAFFGKNLFIEIACFNEVFGYIVNNYWTDGFMKEWFFVACSLPKIELYSVSISYSARQGKDNFCRIHWDIDSISKYTILFSNI